MKTIGRQLVFLIIVCFCTPNFAVSKNAPREKTASSVKKTADSKSGRESKSKRAPKEKKETRPIKNRRPSNPPPGKGRRPSPKPRIGGPKDHGPRGGQPEEDDTARDCLPDRDRVCHWVPIRPEPIEVVVECYIETGYYGESEFDIDKAGVWMSSISIIASSLCLGSGESNSATVSFGISAGSLGLLLYTSEQDRYKKANFVAGAAAIVLGLLNAKMME